MAKALLISEAVVKSLLPISKNMAGDYLRPAIIVAQDRYLEETIGTALTDRLKELAGDDMPEPYRTLLNGYVVKMLAQYTCAGVIQNVSAKIANAGVVRTDEERLYGISASEIEVLRNRYMRDGDMYRRRLQRYLCNHYNDFPELAEYCSCGELRAQLRRAYSGGLWLGGRRGYNLNDCCEK